MKDLPLLESRAMERLEEWGGPPMQRKMIEIFLVHTPNRMEQIREGLNHSEPSAVEAGAHTLKSSAGNLGAIRLQGLCEKIERIAEGRDLGDADNWLPDLEAVYSATCRELEKLLEGMEE
jgi:HPt (histidine-containing phosphotransfer) domain-containing protein